MDQNDDEKLNMDTNLKNLDEVNEILERIMNDPNAELLNK